MSVIELAASDLLGRRAAEAVASIEDPVLRSRVTEAILVCDDALEVVDALDLAPHELATHDIPSLSMWNALAPDARNILLAMRGASQRLLELFPPPPDQEIFETSSVDIDLDQAFEDMAQGRTPPPIRDSRDQMIDDIVEGVSTSQTFDDVGRAIAILAGMLQTDFLSFGERLRSPAVVGDRWYLLSELQEMRQKCSQCFEAVVATVLKACTHEDLEQVLPRYQSAVRRAQQLRTEVVKLASMVATLNHQAKECGLGDLRMIRQALITSLNEFAESGTYAFVRPLDKQQMITFRRLLLATEPQKESMSSWRRSVEGFSKFLDVMRAINDREILTRADHSNLQTARMLLESEEGVTSVLPYLRAVYGRDSGLDLMISELLLGAAVDEQDLLRRVSGAEDTLRNSRSAW